MNSPIATQAPFEDLVNADGDDQNGAATTTPTSPDSAISDDSRSAPVPIKVPPLGANPTSAAPTPSTPAAGAPGSSTTATPSPAPTPGTTTPGATTPGAADTADPTPSNEADSAAGTGESSDDTDSQASDEDKPETPELPPEAANALNGLAGLGPQLASPLINAATGVPAAALQGAGSLVPALTAAVLPQLAAMLSQLGTTAPPGAPAGRIGSGADTLAGPLGALAGEGAASDQARATNEALARQVAALRDVEQQLADILGLSSARTEADRAKIQGIIDDVETALTSAGVQGDTPEAQAAVLAALRQALDEAGDVVSSAARDKLTDAQFVRDLIANYLSAAGSAESLHAGVAGSGAGAAAVSAAHDALGTPYVWGGGGALGPTKGGFDCSGLTQYAVARATGGRVVLPRTTYDQINVGAQVPLTALAPGDLVFSNFSAPGVPEHVAIYVGNGQVIEAPQPGQTVQVSALPSGAQARRVF